MHQSTMVFNFFVEFISLKCHIMVYWQWNIWTTLHVALAMHEFEIKREQKIERATERMRETVENKKKQIEIYMRM